MMKSNKGITLVALVITIIVLLILAGVSISLVVGDNGIMTRAKDAGEKTNTADAVSSFELAVSGLTAEYYEKEYTTTDGSGKDSPAAYIAENINTELGNLGYEIQSKAEETGTPKLDITLSKPEGEDKEADTEHTVTIQKKDTTNGIIVKYTVTTDGNITKISK